VARAEFVDEVFITIPSERELVKRIAVEARQHRLDVKVLPDLYDGLGWHAPIHQVGDFPVMDLYWQPIPALGLFVKRVFDVVVSSLALIICSPFLRCSQCRLKLTQLDRFYIGRGEWVKRVARLRATNCGQCVPTQKR